MARALAVEHGRVQRGNWSFRSETREFEFLWPAKKMVSVQYLPNFEQLLRYRTDLEGLVGEHDQALANLLSGANRAYERVSQSERFQTLAMSSAVADGDRKYLAEYIVNSLRDLPSYYVHHDVWAREGGKFIDLRDAPDLRQEFQSLDELGSDFSKIVEKLRTAVANLQAELADAYKLPPVGSVNARA